MAGGTLAQLQAHFDRINAAAQEISAAVGDIAKCIQAELRQQHVALEEHAAAEKAALDERAAQIREQEQELHQKQQQWDQCMVQSRQHAAAVKEKVKLNVGGKLFVTSKTTLMHEQGTFFYHMLHSDAWEADEDGEYFIDRKPDFFAEILDYLRKGKLDGRLGLDVDALNPYEKQGLYEDIEFYQISSLSFTLGFRYWRIRNKTDTNDKAWTVRKMKWLDVRGTNVATKAANLFTSSSHEKGKVANVLLENDSFWACHKKGSLDEWVAYDCELMTRLAAIHIAGKPGDEPYFTAHVVVEASQDNEHYVMVCEAEQPVRTTDWLVQIK